MTGKRVYVKLSTICNRGRKVVVEGQGVKASFDTETAGRDSYAYGGWECIQKLWRRRKAFCWYLKHLCPSSISLFLSVFHFISLSLKFFSQLMLPEVHLPADAPRSILDMNYIVLGVLIVFDEKALLSSSSPCDLSLEQFGFTTSWGKL